MTTENTTKKPSQRPLFIVLVILAVVGGLFAMSQAEHRTEKAPAKDTPVAHTPLPAPTEDFAYRMTSCSGIFINISAANARNGHLQDAEQFATWSNQMVNHAALTLGYDRADRASKDTTERVSSDLLNDRQTAEVVHQAAIQCLAQARDAGVV